MREELAWHLAGVLKEKEAEGPWRLAYSSSLHGLSFSTFMGKVRFRAVAAHWGSGGLMGGICLKLAPGSRTAH